MGGEAIVITGAAGNLGSKLRHHLQGRYDLRLIDRDAKGDPAVAAFDLSVWDPGWVGLFAGARAVVHLAGNRQANAAWEELLAPNFGAVLNVYQACVEAGVRRVVYASSNHVMGGYCDRWRPGLLTADLPPRPGARYRVDGEARDSTAYGAVKLLGERAGEWFSQRHGLTVIAVRLGWVRPGANRPEEVPPQRGPWFRLMWLSNRDFCQLFERCLLADLGGFLVVYGMSQNDGMPWDLEPARRLLGYAPQDGLRAEAGP